MAGYVGYLTTHYQLRKPSVVVFGDEIIRNVTLEVDVYGAVEAYFKMLRKYLSGGTGVNHGIFARYTRSSCVDSKWLSPEFKR